MLLVLTLYRSIEIIIFIIETFQGTSILVSGATPGEDKGADWALQMEFTLDGNTTRTPFHREPNYITKPQRGPCRVIFLPSFRISPTSRRQNWRREIIPLLENCLRGGYRAIHRVCLHTGSTKSWLD
ncbi:hypothetical protein R3P38DRAFT_68074 [Favolaschia claudopus]|uniref:Uncharacterized protein n=1 Tax=Favolaschia claudopus TaxID=2862362 RepID=A0AAW0D3M1_9AGAR